MRYFKYKDYKKNSSNARKEQYKSLSENEKQIVNKEKNLRRIGYIISYACFFACLAGGFILLALIPKPAYGGWAILYSIGIVIAGFVVFIASLFLAYIITLPLWDRVYSLNLPTMKKEIFRSACSHLRDYYSLQNPYIITKCYDATDKTFKNHDVCIFVAGDELRITTDIVQGFLHGKRDLGCYAFKRDEITLTKLYRDNLLMAHLQAGDFIFLLGYRAKGFIQKNFIQKSKNMFVPCLQRKGSAYYEFQYCKKKGSPKRLANKGYRHWAKDSIVVHVDEGDAFFDSYLGYLECTNAPNGTTQFSECGVNYYTKEQARCMEEKIKEDKPKDFEALIEWLDKAATDYNGFFFLGL